ncbi:MAG: hypothetical protein OEP48_16245 [Betaproteobacteria bacterium]|nr:hypothetical protein [Betaproteobacteria bacterium]MDH3438228.1 hypothetical protein [Betaproteobacteria bacterium]
MLRLWRDRLLVGFSSTELALVRVSGSLRPRIITKRAVPCDPAFGAEPWQGTAAALKDATKGLTGEPLNVAVVLSNHFVRYALVPWDEALTGAEEELAFARHCFTKIHGERAKSWTLRVSKEPAGAPRLASAIDGALLDAIRGCFPKSGKARLVSVQPYLMAAFNRWHRAMPAAGAWLLLVEPERACLALLAKGRWRTVQNAKGAFVSPQEWVTLLDRERHRIDGQTPDTVLVHGLHGVKAHWPHATWKLQGLTLPPLDGYLPLEDGRYATALTAG